MYAVRPFGLLLQQQTGQVNQGLNSIIIGTVTLVSKEKVDIYDSLKEWVLNVES
jgi:hypothetical protein